MEKGAKFDFLYLYGQTIQFPSLSALKIAQNVHFWAAWRFLTFLSIIPECIAVVPKSVVWQLKAVVPKLGGL